jgi:hypothetical protein
MWYGGKISITGVVLNLLLKTMTDFSLVGCRIPMWTRVCVLSTYGMDLFFVTADFGIQRRI